MARDDKNGEAPTPQPAEDIEVGGGAAARRAQGGLSFHFTLDIPKLPPVNSLRTWSHQALINAGLAAGLALAIAVLAFARFSDGAPAASTAPAAAAEPPAGPLLANAVTSFNPAADLPETSSGYVDSTARVTGAVHLGEGSYIGRFASLASDAGQPLHIGERTNVQDLAVISSRPTFVRGKLDPEAFVTSPDETAEWAVFIGDEVTIASQAQVYGPALLGDGAYVGMQALLIASVVETGAVIEPGAIVAGVTIPAGRYVAAGTVVTTQRDADALPQVDETYPYRRAGRDAVELYAKLAQALGTRQPAEADEAEPGEKDASDPAGAD